MEATTCLEIPVDDGGETTRTPDPRRDETHVADLTGQFSPDDSFKKQLQGEEGVETIDVIRHVPPLGTVRPCLAAPSPLLSTDSLFFQTVTEGTDAGDRPPRLAAGTPAQGPRKKPTSRSSGGIIGTVSQPLHDHRN